MKYILLILLLSISLNAKYHKHLHKEKWYQIHGAKQLNGAIEYKIKGVRVDIVTKTHSIEVDFAKKQYEAIGQALLYSIYTKKRAGIVLISEDPQLDLKHILRCKTVCRKHNITLWVIGKKGKIKLIYKGVNKQ
jgi:hypothetical protein